MKWILQFLLLTSLLLPTRTLMAAVTGPEAFGQLLSQVATSDGVAWDRIGSKEKKLLASYLDWVGKAAPNELPTTNDQLAFWVNAHNACVMKIILDHMPLKDAMEIQGFRDRLTCKIAGTERSILELESGIIRPAFKDPRVHFVLWWGVRGGPRLHPTPFAGKDIQTKLKTLTEAFLQDAKSVDLKRDSDRVYLSPLFDWYKHDFGTSEGAVLEFIRKHLPEPNAKGLPEEMDAVSYTSFDWTVDRVQK